MDCKIIHRNRALWCETHDTTSMSLLCERAEKALLDRIVELEMQLAETCKQLQVVEAGAGL